MHHYWCHINAKLFFTLNPHPSVSFLVKLDPRVGLHEGLD